MTNNPYKPGDRIRYNDGDPRIFRIHSIYNDLEVSIGLFDHPDTEQDQITNINEIKLAS